MDPEDYGGPDWTAAELAAGAEWLDEDGNMFVPDFGSKTESEELDTEQWKAEGLKLGERQRELKWEIGDWLLKGKPHYGSSTGVEIVAGHRISHPDVYSVGEEITGLSRRHLVDLASTAERCPVSVRTDGLSWSHHRVLVNERPNDDEEKLTEWLQQAKDEKLPVAAFKELLKGGVGKPPKLERSFSVTVPLCVWEHFKDLADEKSNEEDAEDITVGRYVADILVKQATSDNGAAEREQARQRTKEVRRKRKQREGRRLQRNYPGHHFGSR